MNTIPESRRVAVLAELTEATIDRWFESMNQPTAEYSYVVHRGTTRDTLPDGSAKSVAGGQEFLHSHVVLAPTVAGLEEDRKRYWVGKKQLPMLHQASREAMEHIWTRELGIDRVQALNLALTDRTQRLQAEREQTQLHRLIPSAETIDQNMYDLYHALGVEIPESPASTHTRDHDRNINIDR